MGLWPKGTEWRQVVTPAPLPPGIAEYANSFEEEPWQDEEERGHDDEEPSVHPPVVCQLVSMVVER